jgi:hypothetical protein
MLGYRLAPVVLALDPVHAFGAAGVGRKYTLACWADGDADLDAALDRIARSEPGWGGQPRIKGSPLRAPSRLAPDEVLQALEIALPRARRPKVAET